MNKFVTICSMLLAMCLIAFAGNTASALSTIDALKAGQTGTPNRGGSLDAVGDPLRVVTVPVPSPSGFAISVAADCRGNLYYTNGYTPDLHKIDAFGALIATVSTNDVSGAQIWYDALSWDEGRQMLWAAYHQGIYLVDPNTGIGTYQFQGMGGIDLTDGLAYDPNDGTIWHSTDVSSYISHFSVAGVLLGTLTPLDSFGNPDLTISGICVGTGGRMYVGHGGQGRISIVDENTGAWIGEFSSPGGRDEDLECDAINFAPNLVLWSKDAYDNTIIAIHVEAGTCACAVLPDTCQFPYDEVDMGDLPVCNYPTLNANPGHGISHVAWLGATVTGEPVPFPVNADAGDDGVFFAGLPWMPCTTVNVRVTVTPGPLYGRYQQCGGHLYLNGWKDGNLDRDFCDEIPCDNGTTASEWLVQDALVTPGAWPFSFIDPGVLDIGVYTGVFRWRLTSQPVGRYGFGMNVATACDFSCPGTYGLDFLGEVEDYAIRDAQLSVELSSFSAIAGDGNVVLNWSTASETGNDHFAVMRDGIEVTTVHAAGSSTAQHNYNWTDTRVANGTTYSYTLVSVDVSGTRDELQTVNATPTASAAQVSEYALKQNYPNPFNPSTEIVFDMKEAGFVSLKVYNLMGQEVSTLTNGNMSQGRHTVSFNAAGLPSGVYVYKMEANGFSAQNKMLLMK